MKNENPNLFFFDVETTGLDSSKCRMLSVAYKVTDYLGNVLRQGSAFIKPDGFVIDEESFAFKVNGITQMKIEKDGLRLSDVLLEIVHVVIEYEPVLVAHNFSFDSRFILSEAVHAKVKGFKEVWERLDSFCTSEGSRGIVHERKRARLNELYEFCFQKEFIGHHDAMNDVNAMLDCFFHLKSKGYELV